MDNHGNAPPHIIDGIRRFVDDRIPPGGFLTAVLENDLKEAFSRADNESIAGMFEIVAYCYNEIPGVCWGSPEKVLAWLTDTEVGEADIPEKTEPQPLENVDGFEELMQVEYDAWQRFMRQFYHLAGHPDEAEVNKVGGKFDGFFIALRIWSERLAQLRRPQGEVLELDQRGNVSRRSE